MIKARKIVFRYVKRIVKDAALSFFFPYIYKRAARQGVNDCKVIFLESKQASLPDSYKVLYEYLDSYCNFSLEFISLAQNRVRWKQYFSNCCDAIKEIATAKYVFVNDASDIVSCLPLRDGTKVTQLWHACGAFKKWGMSTANLIFGGSRKDLLRHPYYKNLSLVTVSSPEVSWAYIEAMVLEDCPQIVKPLGVSRTDLFFDEAYIDAAKKNIESLIPSASEKKIILYAPTFRGRVASAEAPDRLDIELFRKELSDDYVLLINHHPFVKNRPEIPESCKNFAFDVSGDIPIDELLICSDICISDYSSLVFEYSLFGRPMLFFAYDLDDYSDWRGFYYDYDELTPGPVYSTNNEMIDYIKNIDTRFDKEEVEDFCNKFMSACDGHATERICNDVFGDDPAYNSALKAHKALQVENPQGIDVSIVVPAYNAMPELTKALESVVKQAYDLSRIEVIVVDDCSTDGTWDELQRFAACYPNLFKIKRLEEPSGSPSKPRNTGLEIAQGTYVFFMDADDWLSPQAIGRMLFHAVVWDSDVLLVKMKGENGRDVPKSMFTKSQPKVDVFKSKAMWTFGPQKLFRRSLVSDLRFPSFMPEDISFVLRAYCTAKTVSVAADYDYYHLAWRDGGEHESLSTWDDIETNLAAYEDIFGFVQDCIPEDERGHVLMRRLLRRDIYRTCVALAKSNDADIAKKYDRLVHIVKPLYDHEAYRTCPVKERIVLDSALLGNFDILQAAVKQGDFLPQACAYKLDDGVLMCRFTSDAGEISCDVTDSFQGSCKVSQVNVDDDALELQGSLIVPQACANGSCEVFLEDKEGIPTHVFDAPIFRIEEAISYNGIPCAKLSWGVTLSFPGLIAMDLEVAHRLTLVYSEESWLQRNILGPNRDLGTKNCFLKATHSLENKRIIASIGVKEAFWLRVG